MKDYQQKFIQLALQNQALKFGNFTLKSGRQSPYFFNAGMFYSGAALSQLGSCYAKAIIDLDIEFDILFGPAYKGISLSVATAIHLANYNKNIDTCFDRKETKQHGEGGMLIGADINNRRVLIIDDVITAGSAINALLEKFANHNVTIAGVIVSIDRQEKNREGKDTIAAITQKIQAPVHSIINYQQLENYLASEGNQHLDAMKAYRKQYGL